MGRGGIPNNGGWTEHWRGLPPPSPPELGHSPSAVPPPTGGEGNEGRGPLGLQAPHSNKGVEVILLLIKIKKVDSCTVCVHLICTKYGLWEKRCMVPV